jgi:hypothetical protein
MRYADKIPFVFILEYLPDDIVVKPMFGCWGIYFGGKLVLFLQLRDRGVLPDRGDEYQNGVYAATSTRDIESLRIEFPDADFQQLKDEKVWIYFNDEAANFERYTTKVCEMITSNDPRIGR